MKPGKGLEHEELTNKIIGCAIEVHKKLGPGFLESIYENAFIVELQKQNLQVEKQREIVIKYDGVEVGRHRLDLIVNDTIVVELKAVKNIEDVHFAIVKSYLKALGKEHGLIINFSKPVLEVKRLFINKFLYSWLPYYKECRKAWKKDFEFSCIHGLLII
jgi:GxxExxY protein